MRIRFDDDDAIAVDCENGDCGADVRRGVVGDLMRSTRPAITIRGVSAIRYGLRLRFLTVVVVAVC